MRAPHTYYVDDRGPEPHRDYLRWYVATSSDEDPAIIVDEYDNGSRTYTYGHASCELRPQHVRAAAAAIAAYERRRARAGAHPWLARPVTPGVRP